jgi:O-succinylbenzoic acid--CoA ligase
MPQRSLRRLLAPVGLSGAREVLDAVNGALTGGPAVALVPKAAPALEAAVLAAVAPDIPLEDDSVAVVLPTSGSTGTPRGVLHTADTLMAAADAAQERLGGPARWVLALSPVHAGGLMVVVRSIADGRGLVVALRDDERFDVHHLAKILEEETANPRPVRVSLVPTQVRDITSAGLLPLLARCDAVLIGAAATPPDMIDELAAAGVRYYSTYGMTETAGGVVWNGEPLPGVSVSVDAADGAEGVISISGPTVALGYRGRPNITAEQFSVVDGERRFRTSDLGRIEPSDTLHRNRLIITGRVDDVVQVAGTSVSLKAIEAVLQIHPDVIEAAIVGVEDDRLGTRIVAVIVPVDGLEAEAIKAAIGGAVESTLGRPARPRDVVLVDAIPMLETGKPDRVELQRLASS